MEGEWGEGGGGLGFRVLGFRERLLGGGGGGRLSFLGKVRALGPGSLRRVLRALQDLGFRV